jgi:hypothetical protein
VYDPKNFTADGVKLISDYHLSDQNMTDSYFYQPVTGFSVAVVANVPVGNNTLVLKLETLGRMIREPSVRWNDPEIVEDNPWLVNIPLPVKVIFDFSDPALNVFVLGKMFANVTLDNWTSFISTKTYKASGYPTAVASLNVLTMGIALVPLPYIKAYGVTSLTLAELLLANSNNDSVQISVPNKVSVEPVNYNDPSLGNSTEPLWPFSFFGNFVYNQEEENCEEPLKYLRYIYWVINNPVLASVSTRYGFQDFSEESIEYVTSQLLEAKCNGEKMLVYENISDQKRSTGLYCITIILTSVFMVMVGFAYYLNPNKNVAATKLNHAVVFFGLVCCQISFTIWWYSPFNDSICIARNWFLNFGYTGVIASVYGRTFSINAVYRHLKKKLKGHTLGITSQLFAFSILFGLQITILIIWTLVEDTRSLEIVTDPINWKTIYTCSDNQGIGWKVQYAYNIALAIWGFYVIYRFWMKQGNEDPRWILMGEFFQVLMFMLLFIIISVTELEDEVFYVITVSVYLIAEATATFTFFIPQVYVSYIKHRSNKESDQSISMNNATKTTYQ